MSVIEIGERERESKHARFSLPFISYLFSTLSEGREMKFVRRASWFLVLIPIIVLLYAPQLIRYVGGSSWPNSKILSYSSSSYSYQMIAHINICLSIDSPNCWSRAIDATDSSFPWNRISNKPFVDHGVNWPYLLEYSSLLCL